MPILGYHVHRRETMDPDVSVQPYLSVMWTLLGRTCVQVKPQTIIIGSASAPRPRRRRRRRLHPRRHRLRPRPRRRRLHLHPQA